MATTTNYGWTTPDDTALVKDGAAAIRTLGTSIDTTTFNNASAAIAKTIVDAKGDIIAATAADTVARLAVGANDTILTADSSTATGLKWAAPAAAGGMTLISETVASAISSLSFSSLGSHKQLLLTWSGIRHSTSGSAFDIRFNNDSGSNYVGANGGQENASGINQNATSTSLNDWRGADPFGFNVTDTNAYSDAFGYLWIDNYTSASKFKFYYGHFASRDHTNSVNRFGHIFGYYASATAITSLDVVRLSGTATFSNQANTTIRLYGLS
jgi:hypothetical protein